MSRVSYSNEFRIASRDDSAEILYTAVSGTRSSSRGDPTHRRCHRGSPIAAKTTRCTEVNHRDELTIKRYWVIKRRCGRVPQFMLSFVDSSQLGKSFLTPEVTKFPGWLSGSEFPSGDVPESQAQGRGRIPMAHRYFSSLCNRRLPCAVSCSR